MVWEKVKQRTVWNQSCNIIDQTVLFLTQHSTSHQDVKKCFGIAAVVKLGTRGIKKLSDGVQISASLVQTLYNTFLKLGRIKSLLFI